MTTERLDLVFAADGAMPLGWRACHPSCGRADAASERSVRFAGDGDPPPLRVVRRGAGAGPDPARLRFVADVSETAHARVVTFRADVPGADARLEQTFEVSRDGYAVALTVRLLGPGAAALGVGWRPELELATGAGLSPPPAAGFAAMLERVSRVTVAGRRGEWTGFRDRFWALLGRPDPGAGSPLTWRYTIYAGPLERHALAGVDPDLERLLFSGLWSWLRALSLALLVLLGWLTLALGDPGAAVIGLALSVKLLLLPLTLVAGRLQAQVDATRARLEPGIAAIRAAYRGEERARRTLALYRAEGVHPFYTLKSLLGVLIQLPVFVAVFDMLAEDFDLYRAPFLWIRDLSQPDQLARLPVCLPFFGCDLNLLPFVMSGVSLAALLRFRSPALTPALRRRQQWNLASMTLLFFLLFYTFPAGMVLYWTTTNAVGLVGQELRRRWAG